MVSATARGSRRQRPEGVGDRAARQNVQDSLAVLRGAVPDLLGSLVASVDGLPLAHDVDDDDPAGIAAMAATAAGLGKRLVESFDFGDFDENVVRARGGYFVVYSAGPMAVLATTASAGANLGRLHLEARRCAMRVALALEGGSP